MYSQQHWAMRLYKEDLRAKTTQTRSTEPALQRKLRKQENREDNVVRQRDFRSNITNSQQRWAFSGEDLEGGKGQSSEMRKE